MKPKGKVPSPNLKTGCFFRQEGEKAEEGGDQDRAGVGAQLCL